jgi:hypothetical protein
MLFVFRIGTPQIRSNLFGEESSTDFRAFFTRFIGNLSLHTTKRQVRNNTSPEVHERHVDFYLILLLYFKYIFCKQSYFSTISHIHYATNRSRQERKHSLNRSIANFPQQLHSQCSCSLFSYCLSSNFRGSVSCNHFPRTIPKFRNS